MPQRVFWKLPSGKLGGPTLMGLHAWAIMRRVADAVREILALKGGHPPGMAAICEGQAAPDFPLIFAGDLNTQPSEPHFWLFHPNHEGKGGKGFDRCPIEFHRIATMVAQVDAVKLFLTSKKRSDEILVQ